MAITHSWRFRETAQTLKRGIAAIVLASRPQQELGRTQPHCALPQPSAAQTKAAHPTWAWDKAASACSRLNSEEHLFILPSCPSKGSKQDSEVSGLKPRSSSICLEVLEARWSAR
eukprot:5202691-Amphidinium_carterae.1